VCDRLDPHLEMTLVNRTKHKKKQWAEANARHKLPPPLLHQFPVSPPHLHLVGTNSSFHAPQLDYKIRSPTSSRLHWPGSKSRRSSSSGKGLSSISAVLCRQSDPTAARLPNHDYKEEGNTSFHRLWAFGWATSGPDGVMHAKYKQPPRNRHIPDPVIREFRSSVALLGNATAIPSNFIPLKHDDAAWLHFLLTVASTLRAPLCTPHGTGRQTGKAGAHNEAHKLLL
jgi:hypothetical protein